MSNLVKQERVEPVSSPCLRQGNKTEGQNKYSFDVIKGLDKKVIFLIKVTIYSFGYINIIDFYL